MNILFANCRTLLRTQEFIQSATNLCTKCQHLQQAQNFRKNYLTLLIRRNFYTSRQLYQKKKSVPDKPTKKASKDKTATSSPVPKFSEIKKLLLLAKPEKYRLSGKPSRPTLLFMIYLLQ